MTVSTHQFNFYQLSKKKFSRVVCFAEIKFSEEIFLQHLLFLHFEVVQYINSNKCLDYVKNKMSNYFS